MSDQLTSAQHMRCVALEAAGRCAEPGMTTSGLLSRAYQCETYIVSGRIRTGPRWLTGTEVGCDDVSVMIEAPDLKPETISAVRDAVQAALR